MRKRNIRKQLLVVFLILLQAQVINICAHTSQKDDENTVSLVTSGSGSTKEEAKNNALRSALEQAFGTFVSSNTKIVNDELVKDEIVSISSGNIKKYDEISCLDLSSGGYEITVKAIVAIGNLVSFAKSHGMSTDLAGNTFITNRNIALLNQKNEGQALNDLQRKISILAAEGLYDFSVETSDPRGDGPFKVRVRIKSTPNKNMEKLWEMIDNTLSGLSMSDLEATNYKKLGFNVYHAKYEPSSSSLIKISDRGGYNLRNDVCSVYGFEGFLEYILLLGQYSYQVFDNMENTITPKYKKRDDSDYSVIPNEMEEIQIGRNRYSVYLTSIPERTETNSEVFSDAYHSKSQFDINYSSEKLSQLTKISVRPHLISGNSDLAEKSAKAREYYDLGEKAVSSGQNGIDYFKKADKILKEVVAQDGNQLSTLNLILLIATRTGDLVGAKPYADMALSKLDNIETLGESELTTKMISCLTLCAYYENSNNQEKLNYYIEKAKDTAQATLKKYPNNGLAKSYLSQFE